MIPIKLTIQGLYSYQEKQTIDFTRLTGAHLFGIFGSVGSGKSTILEAITFAIYGKTDRLNPGDNRNYNMMNLKSKELLIEFDFETGKAQTAYKALVKGRRNGKKFDEVKSLDRSAYRADSGSWVPIECVELEKAIGLSYDNFKRTIIIPQGQFQDFLQLGNKDRTQMMKELFNLEKFELFYKVTSLETKNNALRQNLDGQLKQLGVVDEEMVKQHEQQLKQVREEIDQLTNSLVDCQKKETELKELQLLVKKMDENQLLFMQAKERETEIKALEETVRQYEQCIIRFKSLLDALMLSNERMSQKSALIEQEVASLQKSEKEIDLAERAITAIKAAYDQRDQLKQKADELGKVSRLNVLSISVSKDLERIEKGKLVLDQTVSRAEELKKEKENLELVLKAEKAKLPDLAMLSKVKTWHVENKNLCQQLEVLQPEILKYTREKDQINGAVSAFYQETVIESHTGDTTIELAIQYLKNHIEQLKVQVQQWDRELEHCRVQARLEQYAVNLTDGEQCPLCGSLHHPSVFSPESLAEAMQKANNAKEELEKQLVASNDKIAQLTDISLKLKFNNERLEEQLTRQKQLEEKLTVHKTLFYWNGFSEENLVNEAFSQAESIQKSIREKEEAFSKIIAQHEKELGNRERYQGELDKIQTALAVGQTEISTLSSQIQLVNPSDYRAKTAIDIESERMSLVQQHAILEKKFNELSQQLNQLHKVKDTVSGALEAHRKELMQEQENNAGLQGQFALKLSQAGYQSQEEVKQILALDIDLEAQKQQITNFRQQLSFLQNQAMELQKEIGTRTYDREEHRKVQSGVYNLTETLNQKNQLLGRATESLGKLRKDLDMKVELLQKMEELDLRAENIRLMKSLFKGSGFVNFISSVYLQNLCNAANDRFFQLTRQKLSLEITEDNSFQVRDYMNGGKLRSVKTLSGGQTFQAALSLALALADNIQKITDSNQNFFFLDEGFGSLDKDSLAVVFDSLKSLRKENRIVGVISHVEEMQQEIDTHLRIENQEETGSQISTSWS